MKELLAQDTIQWIDETWDKINKKMSEECRRIGSSIPYSPVNGTYTEDMGKKEITWWTNGFWPGMLWLMYHAAGDEEYRKAAEQVEDRLDEALLGLTELHHDVGFMWLHSAVANYRLTGQERSRARGLQAANILAGRFNINGRFIRAWNENPRTGWMIIDCLMNIPLLYWASLQREDPRFKQMAMAHADTALRVLMREDGSCYHIAALNPGTGELEGYPNCCQGYEPEGSWSRGQAWAIYGFALSYSHTREARYLDAAKKCAHYFLVNAAETGYVPLCDFRAPKEPIIYDTSAGTIAACGLLEIAEAVPECERHLYLNGAVKILKAITQKHCNWNPKEDAIVYDGCVSYHGINERALPLIYGDYFLIEAITRLKGSDLSLWGLLE